MKKTLIIIAAVIAVGLGLWYFATPATERPEGILGAVAGPDVYSDFRVHGTLTYGGRAYATTSDIATYTLTRAELADINLVTWRPDLNTTLTLPASSTMTDIVPNAGDTREFLIYNSSTTAAASITLAAGTGIDLQKNEDTADLAILGLDWGKLTFIRQADSDITVLFEELTEAD